MTYRITDSVTVLMAAFLKYQQDEIDARELDKTRLGNKFFDKSRACLDLLQKTKEGRAALEGLLTHDSAEVRLAAANRVLQWNSDLAIPLLGYLSAHWRPRNPEKGYVPVGFSATLILLQHFGIRNADTNALIGPMRAYGIEMPFDPD